MKEIKIENSNNKLACQGFVHISFAPPAAHFNARGEWIGAPNLCEQVFLIRHEERDLLVKLKSFTRVKFWQISCVDSIAGYGMDSFDWKKQFKEKYPDTTEETEMAVYCYLKETV